MSSFYLKIIHSNVIIPYDVLVQASNANHFTITYSSYQTVGSHNYSYAIQDANFFHILYHQLFKLNLVLNNRGIRKEFVYTFWSVDIYFFCKNKKKSQWIQYSQLMRMISRWKMSPSDQMSGIIWKKSLPKEWV